MHCSALSLTHPPSLVASCPLCPMTDCYCRHIHGHRARAEVSATWCDGSTFNYQCKHHRGAVGRQSFLLDANSVLSLPLSRVYWPSSMSMWGVRRKKGRIVKRHYAMARRRRLWGDWKTIREYSKEWIFGVKDQPKSSRVLYILFHNTLQLQPRTMVFFYDCFAYFPFFTT